MCRWCPRTRLIATRSDWTWACRKSERAHMEPATALAVSPDGKFIGTGTVEGSIAIFATETCVNYSHISTSARSFIDQPIQLFLRMQIIIFSRTKNLHFLTCLAV